MNRMGGGPQGNERTEDYVRAAYAANPGDVFTAPPYSAAAMWQLQRLGEPDISPDGRLAVVPVTRYDVSGPRMAVEPRASGSRSPAHRAGCAACHPKGFCLRVAMLPAHASTGDVARAQVSVPGAGYLFSLARREHGRHPGCWLVTAVARDLPGG